LVFKAASNARVSPRKGGKKRHKKWQRGGDIDLQALTIKGSGNVGNLEGHWISGEQRKIAASNGPVTKCDLLVMNICSVSIDICRRSDASPPRGSAAQSLAEYDAVPVRSIRIIVAIAFFGQHSASVNEHSLVFEETHRGSPWKELSQ
jgi:hypothetical protein